MLFPESLNLNIKSVIKTLHLINRTLLQRTIPFTLKNNLQDEVWKHVTEVSPGTNKRMKEELWDRVVTQI